MIYLASASPRRKTLLEKEGYKIKVVKSDYNETNEPRVSAYSLVMEQAAGKALATKEHLREEGVVIGADTIVVLNGQCLGKPVNTEDAFRILSLLSGRTHEVVTGVSIVKGDMVDTFFISTRITFKSVSERAILDYIATGSPMDKAGAYGLQDLSDTWIAAVDGSISNVIGLPMEAVKERLALMGIYPG